MALGEAEKRVLDVLIAADSGPALPIAVLAAACARLGGSPSEVDVRTMLVSLGPLVARGAAGTPDEIVSSTLRGFSDLRVHAAIADAAAMLAPTSAAANRYAEATEAEHLWLAGRPEEALRSLEARPLAEPALNYERWADWVPRFHPTSLLGIQAQARCATWTGKADEPRRAIQAFVALLPTAVRHLSPCHRETLSIRNNIAYLVGALGDHRKAMRLFAQLVIDSTAALSATDEETLHNRHLLAWTTAKCGFVSVALHQWRQLLSDVDRELASNHKLAFNIRDNIDFWTAETRARSSRGRNWTHRHAAGADR
ncbi:hypothetical protein EV193_102373 [Herbihabitans rhizosphaerae]|uniref:Tetratricopeptide repeat protein n=2 Tax=Herbihabitans rhizosphaerae TaxID=1872711 RepID=A0A4Q7L2M1_9PSEU|nr:hypothetical protein EV193_102373 [Herbihabitans rhizosphaerae]